MNNDLISQDILKFNLSDAAIAEMSDKYLPLVINGIEDKEGYKAVNEARVYLKRRRGQIEKTRKMLKEDSLRYGRAIDAEAKKRNAQLLALEDSLSLKQQEIDNEKEKIRLAEVEQRKAVIQNRIDSLLAVGAPIYLEEINQMDDATFESVLLEATKDYERQQERERKLRGQQEAERISAQKAEQELAELKKRNEEAEALAAKRHAELLAENERLAAMVRANEVDVISDAEEITEDVEGLSDGDVELGGDEVKYDIAPTIVMPHSYEDVLKIADAALGVVDNHEMVTITDDEYQALQQDSRMLECLYASGVKDWDGYEEACWQLNQST